MDTPLYVPGGKRPHFLLSFIRCLRPKQWTKNLLIFAALVFANEYSLELLVRSLLGFALICLTSGCVYILNDFLDRDKDKLHPEKRFRPMASGLIHPHTALLIGILLLLITLSAAFVLSWTFSLLLAVYFLMNVAYSVKLKNVVIFDILIIAAGFVLRAVGGGLIIDVSLTPWFLICTLLLALFLAICKRRHEFLLLSNTKSSHRQVLDYYSAELLNQLNSIVTTATIISYALFTFTSGKTIYLMWTIPLVIYGIFRYLYLIYMEDKGGTPEKVLFEDKPLLVTVILYAVTVFIVLNLPE